MLSHSTLSTKIDKILIAEPSLDMIDLIKSAVSSKAPHAAIRVATNQNKMKSELQAWMPVMMVVRLDWLFSNGRCIFSIHGQRDGYTPPFMLGLNDRQTTAYVVDAVRYGCSKVIDLTHDEQTIQQGILASVYEQLSMPLLLSHVIAAQLYNDQGRFDLKNYIKDVENNIFRVALTVTQSKNGLSKLLGISRQLVQYHLKKL